MQVIDIAVKAYSGAKMDRRQAVELRSEDGIDGNYQNRGKRQVTVLFQDDWLVACHEVGVELPWTTRRANILVTGTGLPKSKGTILQFANCTLEITGETTPCNLMEESQAGLRAALGKNWLGGVTCKVVGTGRIVVGDSLTVKTAQPIAAD